MKQINWAEMPMGVVFTSIVLKNELFRFASGDNKSVICICSDGSQIIFSCNAVDLAPPDQQPWLYFEHRVTAVPEWAVVEYQRAAAPTYLYLTVAYRIIGIKEGYTL